MINAQKYPDSISNIFLLQLLYLFMFKKNRFILILEQQLRTLMVSII